MYRTIILHLKNGGGICSLSAEFRRLNRGPKAGLGGVWGGEAPPSLNAGVWGAPAPQCEEKAIKTKVVYIYIYV